MPASDPTSAIAMAVGQIANTVGVFVNSGAQRFGFAKSIDAEGISISRQKALSAYTSIAATQKTVLIVLAVLAAIVLIVKSKKNG